MDTYKDAPDAGLQYLFEYYMLLLFVKLNFLFEFETAIQPGFEPRSPGTKAAMLTIELHSIGTAKQMLKNEPTFYFLLDKNVRQICFRPSKI